MEQPKQPNKKTKRFFIDFEDPARKEFTCIHDTPLTCIQREKQEDGRIQVSVCPMSPCYLNEYKFAIHEKIVRTYFRMEDWEEAYYYYCAILSNFDTCRFGNSPKIQKMDLIIKKVAQIEKESKDLDTKTANNMVKTIESLKNETGCKIFTEKGDLAKILEVIIQPVQSDRGKEVHKGEITKFKQILLSSLKDIELIALSNRAEKIERHEKMKYNILTVGTGLKNFTIESMDLGVPAAMEDVIKNKDTDLQIDSGKKEKGVDVI